MPYSDAYVECLSQGPFPGQVDPWAEAAQYFHQIHGCMIGEMLERLRVPLLKMGYIASRETSLQVLEHSQPDVAVCHDQPSPSATWDYAAAAEAIQVEPGSLMQDAFPELEAVYIRQTDELNSLVTVLEVVSPGNKDRLADIAEYQDRRQRIVRDKRVNVVEIDLTRSVKRLVRDRKSALYAYHIAIHRPSEARLIGLDYGDPLQPFALPLVREVIGVETQQVYDASYRQASVAPQIEMQGDYGLANLPFPSLLTDTDKQGALNAVRAWQEKLKSLK